MEKICKKCGGEFVATNPGANLKKYCSKTCQEVKGPVKKRKECNGCKKTKMIKFFHVRKNGYVSYLCRKCTYLERVEYRKTDAIPNRRARLREMVNHAKSRPCHDCGRSFPPYCMDLDHRDPEKKKYDISDMPHRVLSPERVREEIEKCDVVCAVCHRIRTHEKNAYSSRPIRSLSLKRTAPKHVRIRSPKASEGNPLLSEALSRDPELSGISC